ncbi:ABC-three component system protein [Acinetobacter variabilis]|uniref:ABC-three component systems C-terminal domain-containing protein n=1 Tax=Acinetobacter variabilis TaxID=70346 RepID=N9P9H6_9GAMM|nr:ABC-three component system protein [Acinetobacter variabilis]ENX10885.1 hypothetical protein F897_00564 [Acinetobacter variabilis]UBI29759.1 hypothetical protein LA331_10785 [Acinetobacter variabilis]
MFKLKVYESSGESFQKLFSNVMHHSVQGFQAVTPAGRWGDGGNDGWVEAEKCYFQVYGPKPTTNSNPVSEVEKAFTDFDKLEQKWGTVEKYYFVINDRFEGVSALVQNKLFNFKKEKKLTNCEPFASRHLLDAFLKLNEDIQEEILNTCPLGDLPEDIDYGMLSELVNNLIERVHTNYLDCSSSFFEVPNFEDKLLLNKLSPGIAMRLRQNSYRAYEVDDFIERTGDHLKQDLAIEINSIYKRSLDLIPDTDPQCADLRYIWMIDEILPLSIRSRSMSGQNLIAYKLVAEIILAKFFETCDVYEHPDNVERWIRKFEQLL